MAEKGVFATRDESRLLPGEGGQFAADNRIHTMEDRPEAAPVHPVGDHASTAPKRGQLLVRQNRALPTSQHRDRSIPTLGHKSGLDERLLPSPRS